MQSTQMEFNFHTVKRISFGYGKISNLGKEAKNFAAKTVLLVTDKNLKSLGLINRIETILKNENLKTILYDGVSSEPELEIADSCAQLGKKEKCDLIIGIGGGSVLDVAKAAAILITNEGKAEEYQGFGSKIKAPGVKTILVPTTAGTGSEVTPTAVFINRRKKIKLGINSSYLFTDLVLLDPELTLSLPKEITASTGMDALTHAIESYVAKRSSPISDMFALEAFELIWNNLPLAVKNGQDVQARTNLLLGSCLAGIAIANAGVGAAHALSYPLSVFFKIPHGLANGILIPYIMRYNYKNRPDRPEKFAHLAQKMSILEESEEKAVSFVWERVVELNEKIGIPKDLSKFNIPESAIPGLVENTFLLKPVIENNPHPFDEKTAREILEELISAHS
ncbi:MAG TPA: alcohol dehydrogenase [Elusimicrobia bacterium]|jgi:alcohol dehydrogenase|nr:alcohol dehydrogenase [Elusimicrobiota bacterium]